MGIPGALQGPKRQKENPPLIRSADVPRYMCVLEIHENPCSGGWSQGTKAHASCFHDGTEIARRPPRSAFHRHWDAGHGFSWVFTSQKGCPRSWRKTPLVCEVGKRLLLLVNGFPYISKGRERTYNSKFSTVESLGNRRRVSPLCLWGG